MSKPSKTKSPRTKGVSAAPATLAAVLTALELNSDLGPTRVRDLRSAVKRVAVLLGQEPAALRLDLPEISTRLAEINPVAAGMTAKRFTNIRSDFIAAVKASGVTSKKGDAKAPLSPAWVELFRRLSGRRAISASPVSLVMRARRESSQRM
jgi:hypothetical protein